MLGSGESPERVPPPPQSPERLRVRHGVSKESEKSPKVRL